jgi:fibronectin-binding autotransporter adhesin
MTTEYNYSISGDFTPSGVDPSQLQEEIEAEVLITVTISYIYTNDDDLYTVFPSALSAPEKTALDTVISNHIPNNINNYSVTQSGYIQFNSTLADNQAIRILASDTAGGIDINAGNGGITIDTTNGISIDSQAESNFSVTGGNLILESDALTCIQSSGTGSAGIIIGTDTVDQTINIGTGTGAKNITIGNTSNSTSVDINTGTGGFSLDTASGGSISLDANGASSNFTLTSNGDGQDLTFALLGNYDSSIILDSQGTGTDAIKVNSSGGIDIDATKSINLTTTSTASDAIRLNTGGGLDVDTSGTINFATADNTGGAITLDAAFNNGGINISSGTQGIAMNSNGGLIGIGNWSGGNISIGTAAVARTLTLGNTTSTTSVIINAGSGGIDANTSGRIDLDTTDTSVNALRLNSAGGIDVDASNSINLTTSGTGTDAIRLSSAGGLDVDATKSINLTTTSTASDAIRLNTGGGLDVDTTGLINISTGSSAGGAITLDAAFNNGGITISSGTQGIAVNSNGGLIGVGNWSGGNIEIGTAAVARSLTVGNTTSTTSVAVNAGSGGITIGNNANGGEIQIGNVSNAKTLTIGNNTGASKLITRWGTGGNIKYQGAETSLSDSNATLTMTQLLTQILSIGPTADRTLTLPTAANAVSGISGVQVNDCIDFTIIHTTTSATDPYITVAMGSGGSSVGFMDIHPSSNNAGTYFSSGSATFRMRFTNIGSGTETYTCYRIS